MTQIDQMSKKLFTNNSFIRQLKNTFQRYYEQKNQKQKQEDYIKPIPQNQVFRMNERCIQDLQEPHIVQSRCSVTSGVYSKRQSRDSISSMTSNPFLNQYMNSYSSSSSVNQITNQITSILADMIKKQCVLNARVSSVANQGDNISELIQKMQAIQKQQISILKIGMEEKIQKLKAEIQYQVVSIIQKLKSQRKNKKFLDKTSQIKKQRRKVTQSILDITKNNQQMSTFSNIYDVGNILSDSEDEDNLDKRNSPELSQLSQKLSEVQKSQSKISKQFEDKFLKQVDQNSKDIQALTERIIEWKMKNEQKLQNGFTGVWNIMTDLQDKLNKVSLRVSDLQKIFALSK